MLGKVAQHKKLEKCTINFYNWQCAYADRM
jgi:hypothetical protein